MQTRKSGKSTSRAHLRDLDKDGKAAQLVQTFQLRLSYARYKVDNNWEALRLDEVENLTFRKFELQAQERAEATKTLRLAAREARPTQDGDESDDLGLIAHLEAEDFGGQDDDTPESWAPRAADEQAAAGAASGTACPVPSATVLGKRKAVDPASYDEQRAHRHATLSSSLPSSSNRSPVTSSTSIASNSTSTSSRPFASPVRTQLATSRPTSIAPGALHTPAAAGGYDSFWASMGSKTVASPSQMNALSPSIGTLLPPASTANLRSPPSNLLRSSPTSRPRSPFQPATSFSSLTSPFPVFTASPLSPDKGKSNDLVSDNSVHLSLPLPDLPPPLAPPLPKRGSLFKSLGPEASFSALAEPPPLPVEFADAPVRSSREESLVRDDDVGHDESEHIRGPFEYGMSQEQDDEITLEDLDKDF